MSSSKPEQGGEGLSIYGIDENFLLNTISGDREFLMVLLGVFYESRSVAPKELVRLKDAGDEKGFCLLLHTFLGSASSCGAVEACRLGRLVYNKAKSEGLRDIDPLFAEFVAEAEKVMLALGEKLRG